MASAAARVRAVAEREPQPMFSDQLHSHSHHGTGSGGMPLDTLSLRPHLASIMVGNSAEVSVAGSRR